MLLDQFRKQFADALMRFLWRQWSQLGIAGHIEFRDRWLIDPETLLVFTLQAGRRDPRLYDEVIDWTVRNSSWISVQRLKNIVELMHLDTASRATAAVASIVTDIGRDSRWRSLVSEGRSDEQGRTSLFIDHSGAEMPVLAQPDPAFARAGILRSTIQLRGLSLPVPMEPRTNLVFRLRALFGLGARAEVVAYLLTHLEAHPSEIARSVHYGPQAVGDALAGLAQSGAVIVREARRGSPYSLHKPRWRQFLRVVPPSWIDWPGVFRALAAVESFLFDPLVAEASDYMTRSQIASATEEINRNMIGSGLSYRSVTPQSAFRNPRLFLASLRALLSALNPAPAKRSSPPETSPMLPNILPPRTI